MKIYVVVLIIKHAFSSNYIVSTVLLEKIGITLISFVRKRNSFYNQGMKMPLLRAWII